MQPNPPAPGGTPEPADSLKALDAQLVDMMAQAEIAANAQRDLEAGTPPGETDRHEATPPQPGDETDDDEDDDTVPAGDAQEESEEDVDGEQDEDDEADEAEEPPSPAPAQQQQQQPRYGRRAAARLATELEQTRSELESAKREAESHKNAVSAARLSEQRILNHLKEHSGYTVEPNGQFRYVNLSQKVLSGQASPEEQEEVALMTQWHQFAAPIFRAAEEQVTAGLATDWKQLGALPGIGEEGLKKLNAAPNPIKGMQDLHQLAFSAGESKARSESEATIKRLRAEVKSLKTTKLAGAPQPASVNGAAIATNGSFLSKAIDPSTGLSNPDFDRQVSSGKWLGVDLSKQT